jgi:hypothetical protein
MVAKGPPKGRLWGFRDISSSMGRHDGGSLSAMGSKKTQLRQERTHWTSRGRDAFEVQPWLKYERAGFMLALAAAVCFRGAERRGAD